MQRGFDPAFCMDMPKPEHGIGHAILRPAESLTDFDTPIVPVLLNCYYAPQPTADALLRVRQGRARGHRGVPRATCASPSSAPAASGTRPAPRTPSWTRTSTARCSSSSRPATSAAWRSTSTTTRSRTATPASTSASAAAARPACPASADPRAARARPATGSPPPASRTAASSRHRRLRPGLRVARRRLVLLLQARRLSVSQATEAQRRARKGPPAFYLRVDLLMAGPALQELRSFELAVSCAHESCGSVPFSAGDVMTTPELRAFHVGIVVKSLVATMEQYGAMFDVKRWHRAKGRFNGLRDGIRARWRPGLRAIRSNRTGRLPHPSVLR